MHKRVASSRKNTGIEMFRKTYRLAAIIAIVVAVMWQLVYSYTQYATFDSVNFFSFFTIEANLIGAVALCWLVFGRKKTATMEIFRGAATLYLAITGVVFALLLTNIEVQLTLPVVDLILHKILPIVIVADWLFDPPTRRFTLKQLSTWFIYPILWLGYTLLRGPFADWYPYPFLDPRLDGGYGRVGIYVVGILNFAIVVTAALVAAAMISHKFYRKK
jgi:hypothetical protein